MELRQAAQQALDACTDAISGWQSLAPLAVRRAAEEALQDLRDALAEPAQEIQLKRVHPLDMPLEVFVKNISTRSRNIINTAMRHFAHSGDDFIKSPFTVRHLLMFSRKELCKWPNLGKYSLNEIEEALRNHGLQLWDVHDERSLRLLRDHLGYSDAAPNYYHLIHSINWVMLREQKQWLMSQEHVHAEGILKMIDHLQDHAVDNLLISEEKVFGTNYEND
jgi:hypothetical protein